MGKRLKKITTKAGNEVFRTYDFTYYTSGDGSTTKFSRISSITETGANGQDSRDLTANWNFLPTPTQSKSLLDISLPSNNSLLTHTDRNFLACDLNGDGISDILQLSSVKKRLITNPNFVEDKYYIYVYRSHINNSIISYDTQPLLYETNNTLPFIEYVLQKGGTTATDLDGDGYNDLLLPYYWNTSGVNVFSCKVIWGSQVKNGDNTFDDYDAGLYAGTEMPLYAISDVDNNGKGELLFLEKQPYNGKYVLHIPEYIGTEGGPVYLFHLTLSSAPRRMFAADFNNDGLSDIMVICDDGYRIFYNQGNPSMFNTSLANAFVDSSTLNTSIGNHQQIDMGDFNGDGIPDLIWGNQDTYSLYFELGNGDGTFTRHLACNIHLINIQNKTRGTWNCIVTDIDHDGKSDIVLNSYDWWNEITHTYWMRSNGTNLTLLNEATSVRRDDANTGHIFVGDFKGKGYNEIANYGYDCYYGSEANTDPTLNIYSCNNHDVYNGKVNYFTDSNQRKTSFTYATMTSDQVYTKGTDSQYPLVDVAAPLCVTSQVKEWGGSPVITQTNYTYAGLRGHLQGRGLLGFREVTAHETNTGKTVTTTASEDNSTFLVPTKVTIETTQGGCTSTSESTMTLKTFSSSTAQYADNYMLFPTTNRDVDIYGNETTTTCQYHVTNHYLTSQRTEYGSGNMYKQTSYQYPSAKIAGAWRPTSITQTQKHSHYNSPFSSTTTIAYNSNGLKTSVTEYANTSLALTTQWQYDSYGNITKETLSGSGIASGTETNYQYDSNGKFLIQKSSPVETTAYTRNSFGEVTAMTEYANSSVPLVTNYTYSGFGMLTGEAKATGENTIRTRTASTSYNGAYLITDSISKRPAVRTWYDALGNKMREQTSGVGQVVISTTNTYNARGELTAASRVHGQRTIADTFTYDNLGRLTAVTSTDGSSISYMYGNRTDTITENGCTTARTYDAWGNVLTTEDPVSSVSYIYHSNGKPYYVTAGNGTITMIYDNAGNQILLDDPDAGSTDYEYDALHRITMQTDARGWETCFSYDNGGRLIYKEILGGPGSTSYTYGTSGNADGQIVSIQRGGNIISYSYDDKHRLSQEVHAINGHSPITFGYNYDSYGRLASKDYPQGVNVKCEYRNDIRVGSSMGYKNISRITKDDGLECTRTMGGTTRAPLTPSLKGGDEDNQDKDRVFIDPFLNVLDKIFNPVLTHTANYDSRGYLTELKATRGTNILNQMTFSFEGGTGNLLSRSGMTSQTETFQYDGIDRLIQSNQGSVTSQVITYTNKGNIASKTGLGSYTYGIPIQHPSAVMSVANTDSIIPSATQTATYDPYGKIQQLSDNGYNMSFTYGPDGERCKTVLSHNGIIQRTTLYAGDYERITENGTTRHIYYLDGGAIYVLADGASASSGSFYYAFTDHLGSITRIYDSNANEVFSAEYDPWGQQTVSTNTLGFHRGFTGHEMLPEFGLINMNGRLYDPIVGRFLSPDNYVQFPDCPQSFNRYSYCLNNPLKYTDPSGEFSLLAIGLAIAGAYLGGVASNGGELNPFYWDYSEPMTYLSIGVGAIAGSITGSVIGGSSIFGISFTAGNAYLAGGVTIGNIAKTGLKWGFHWSTSAGGGGIISNIGNSDSNVDKAISKIREDYHENSQNFNDFNNIIGDITYGVKNNDPFIYKNNAIPINTFSTGINIGFNYTEIIGLYRNTLDDYDMKNLYINAFGDVGAYIGGFMGGSAMFAVFSESGSGAKSAGIWGAVMGAQMGRKVLGSIGGYYYDICVVLNINKQINEMQNFNRTHYPMQILFPY